MENKLAGEKAFTEESLPDRANIATAREFRYSIFGISVDRRHALKWLFHQEKATFPCTKKVYSNSENALVGQFEPGLPSGAKARTHFA